MRIVIILCGFGLVWCLPHLRSGGANEEVPLDVKLLRAIQDKKPGETVGVIGKLDFVLASPGDPSAFQLKQVFFAHRLGKFKSQEDLDNYLVKCVTSKNHVLLMDPFADQDVFTTFRDGTGTVWYGVSNSAGLLVVATRNAEIRDDEPRMVRVIGPAADALPVTVNHHTYRLAFPGDLVISGCTKASVAVLARSYSVEEYSSWDQHTPLFAIPFNHEFINCESVEHSFEFVKGIELSGDEDLSTEQMAKLKSFPEVTVTEDGMVCLDCDPPLWDRFMNYVIGPSDADPSGAVMSFTLNPALPLASRLRLANWIWTYRNRYSTGATIDHTVPLIPHFSAAGIPVPIPLALPFRSTYVLNRVYHRMQLPAGSPGNCGPPITGIMGGTLLCTVQINYVRGALVTMRFYR